MMDSEVHDDSQAGPSGPARPEQEDRGQIRARILRRFETWLDEVLQDEQPIEGIPARILEQLQAEPVACTSGETEPGYDLYSLWSAVTAMTEETRLQGRAFKQLHESLGPMQEMVGSVGDVLGQCAAAVDRQDQRINESTRQAVLKEVLATLIDVRDRLTRGADTVQTWLEGAVMPLRAGFAARLWRRGSPSPAQVAMQQQEAVRSLLKGYNLSREVLDEALARFGVRPMDSLGRPFDPGSMRAVDIDTESDAEDGTVLEIYRQGYWWNDTVYRPAEVKVARRQPEGP